MSVNPLTSRRIDGGTKAILKQSDDRRDNGSRNHATFDAYAYIFVKKMFCFHLSCACPVQRAAVRTHKQTDKRRFGPRPIKKSLSKL